MDRDYVKAWGYSATLHALLFFLFAFAVQSFRITPKPVFLELNLIGESSRGEGPGAEVLQSGRETVSPEGASSAEGVLAEPKPPPGSAKSSPAKEGGIVAKTTPHASSVSTGERRSSTTPSASSTPAHLALLEEEEPIGIVPRKNREAAIKTTTGLGLGLVAGTPHGRAIIEGQLAGRAVRKQIFPEYPKWAREQGIEGSVQYRLVVLPNGLLKNPLILEKTSGYRELDRVVYEALLQWEFEPLPPEVSPVEQSGTILFLFNFKQRPSTAP